MARRAHSVVTTATRLALLYLAWLWIDDNVSEPELFTGLGAALLALVLSSLSGRSSSVAARLRPRMLRYLYRLPILLVADSFRVCWVVIRQLALRRERTGHFRAVRYDACGEDEIDVARRALTEWAASVAPNRYVIGVDRESGTLLVHELAETKGSLDPLELG